MKIPGISGADSAGADAPSLVRYSFWAWSMVATIGLLEAVLLYASRQGLTDIAVRANPQLSPDQVASAVGNLLLVYLVMALVFAVLYVWFALKARAGVSWGRMAVTGLAVLNLLLRYFFGLSYLGVAGVVLALAAIVMLFLPSSNAYFQSARQ